MTNVVSARKRMQLRCSYLVTNSYIVINNHGAIDM